MKLDIWLLIVPSTFSALALFVALWQKPSFVSVARLDVVRQERDDLIEQVNRQGSKIAELESLLSQTIVERDFYRSNEIQRLMEQQRKSRGST